MITSWRAWVNDQVLWEAKGKQPVVPFAERLRIVRSMACVDEAVEDVSSDKVLMWERVGFDVIFKGDDWRGTPKGDRLEADLGARGVRVVYFPYTAHTSSTTLRARIKRRRVMASHPSHAAPICQSLLYAYPTASRSHGDRPNRGI